MGSRPTIVVVDDDKHLVELLQEYLEAAGYQVYAGFDGQAAVALARAHKPDLIVMDVDMPLTNGLKALKTLREAEATKTIPVIMLTGVVSERVYPEIEGLPKVSHLKKPVSLEDLGSLVKHYIPRAAKDQ